MITHPRNGSEVVRCGGLGLLVPLVSAATTLGAGTAAALRYALPQLDARVRCQASSCRITFRRTRVSDQWLNPAAGLVSVLITGAFVLRAAYAPVWSAWVCGAVAARNCPILWIEQGLQGGVGVGCVAS